MRREATLIPRFAGGPYGPGDTVEGVLVAEEANERSRMLRAELRYVDRSPSLSGSQTYDTVAPLHEGPVALGQEIRFALRLPPDAYPNWEHELTANAGSLSWALVIEEDIQAGLDTIATHAIPIDTLGRTWTGPAPTGERRIKGLVDDWDVEVEPDRWALRRGEEVTVTVRIGKPKESRPKLEFGVACQAFSVVETRRPGESGSRRTTNHIDLFDHWPALDPSLPEQAFTARIPEDGPFTYRGTAFGFVWMAVAREKRRWFQSDAGRIAYLEVMP